MKYFLVFALILVLLGCTQQPDIVDNTNDYHTHADDEYHTHVDFKVFLNNAQVDFNKTDYMSNEYEEHDESVHLHGFNPNVIHFHNEGITLQRFFNSSGITFTSNCFEIGSEKYCESTNEKLLLYVNGSLEEEKNNYVPMDLDKILIYYGHGEPTERMFASVTNEACIYSEKCDAPEGFIIEPENCSISKPCVLPEGEHP